ncbi:MAG: hypothetical protein F6K26_53190 [Moorea sp. SIO2I5]|nr:hypothetical protein [Moorena sp. SIO2I5]
MKHPSATVAFKDYREMLQQSIHLLPKEVIGDPTGRSRVCPHRFNESFDQ